MELFDAIEIQMLAVLYILGCTYIDAPTLISLNLCDFLRDPKGQL